MAVVDGILLVEDKQSLSQLINDLVVGDTGANASAVNRFEHISIHIVLKGVAVLKKLLDFFLFAHLRPFIEYMVCEPPVAIWNQN